MIKCDKCGNTFFPNLTADNQLHCRRCGNSYASAYPADIKAISAQGIGTCPSCGNSGVYFVIKVGFTGGFLDYQCSDCGFMFRLGQPIASSEDNQNATSTKANVASVPKSVSDKPDPKPAAVESHVVAAEVKPDVGSEAAETDEEHEPKVETTTGWLKTILVGVFSGGFVGFDSIAPALIGEFVLAILFWILRTAWRASDGSFVLFVIALVITSVIVFFASPYLYLVGLVMAVISAPIIAIAGGVLGLIASVTNLALNKVPKNSRNIAVGLVCGAASTVAYHLWGYDPVNYVLFDWMAGLNYVIVAAVGYLFGHLFGVALEMEVVEGTPICVTDEYTHTVSYTSKQSSEDGWFSGWRGLRRVAEATAGRAAPSWEAASNSIKRDFELEEEQNREWHRAYVARQAALKREAEKRRR